MTVALAALVAGVTANGRNESRSEEPLQRNSLCAQSEKVIFSCRTKAAKSSKSAGKLAPGKLVSLCASPDLTRERGYLQYRYGLPGKIELEFPSSHTGTQQMFQYTHYMRYQVDLTEINFQIDDYQYQIFDNYNGEEKPAIAEQGVSVTVPGRPKTVSFICAGKAKADYSALAEVLNQDAE